MGGEENTGLNGKIGKTDGTWHAHLAVSPPFRPKMIPISHGTLNPHQVCPWLQKPSQHGAVGA